MPLKIDEFVIKANIIEDENQFEKSDARDDNSKFSDSIKQEIIDECMVRIKALMEREKTRY